MLTDYDHLLFLLGVMSLMSHFGNIVELATAFTVGHTLTLNIGHTLTLIGATKAGVRVDHFLIDALIALT